MLSQIRRFDHAISIHALREEGDICSLGYDQLAQIFLSTPSARRATVAGCLVDLFPAGFLSTPSARRATHFQRLATQGVS